MEMAPPDFVDRSVDSNCFHWEPLPARNFQTFAIHHPVNVARAGEPPRAVIVKFEHKWNVAAVEQECGITFARGRIEEAHVGSFGCGKATAVTRMKHSLQVP